MSEERGNLDKECLIVGSHECLLSSSDEGSEGLEKFLRDKLESLGGDGIENIAEVDPAGVLELLDSNFVDRDNTGSGVVTVDDEFPSAQVDSILRSELQEKAIGGRSKRSLCDVDFGVVDERPSKSVAFEFDESGGRLFSDRCTLVGVSDAGQSFPSSSQPGDSDYGTSELEWLHEDELVVWVGEGFWCCRTWSSNCLRSYSAAWFGCWAFKVLPQWVCKNPIERVLCW